MSEKIGFYDNIWWNTMQFETKALFIENYSETENQFLIILWNKNCMVYCKKDCIINEDLSLYCWTAILSMSNLFI